MRRFVLLCILLIAASAPVLCADDKAQAPGPACYYLVLIRPDPARVDIPMEDRQRILSAHMANIAKMASDGVLAAAGPMDETPITINGIFVLKAASLDVAKRIASSDPLVVGKRCTVDVHPWMGPPGVGDAYFRNLKEHPDAKDVMAIHILCLVKRGESWKASAEGDPDHDSAIEALHAAGALSAAGPITGDPSLVGLLIFKTGSLDEAAKSLGADPAVKSGRLAIEYHKWWSADGVLPW